MSAMKVGVVGAAGRMGQEVLRALSTDDRFDLVLAIDNNSVGESVHQFTGGKGADIAIESKLGAALDRVPCDAIIDFTSHSCAAAHAISALKRKVAPVIGTTGMSDPDQREIAAYCREQETPALYAPNFAVGAVLMMRFSQMAAKFFPNAEIIELHHDRKEDAPSGTAMLTAEMISNARPEMPKTRRKSIIKAEGARGGLVKDVPVHSIRLPGFVAHQRVIFGGAGETLTIQHDSMDRTSFMEGVKLCLLEVRSLSGFVVGMDKVLFRQKD
jgi:4-hydroxy-tetrahydrodipicolinate reductase